jgi:integrase
MAKDLTERTLQSLVSEQGRPRARRETADGKVRGLYFVVQPSGKASWALRYRFYKASRKLTIGPFPSIGLKVARQKAGAALVELAKGGDPTVEKRKSAAAARVTADLDTVDDVAVRFIKRYASKNRSCDETERILTKEIVSRWRGRPLASIRRADVHTLLDEIVDRGAPIMANRTLAALRRMCAWAVERDIITESPAGGVRPPSSERTRDRVLSDDELRLLWRVCDAIAWPFGPLTQLLVLSGQRLREVAEARWSEFDLEARIWTLPKERVKNGIEQIIPLSTPAFAILNGLPRIKGKDGFVFTTTGRTPVSGFAQVKIRLDALLLAELRKGAAEPEKIRMPHWTLHDLRRTFASGCARLGINMPVIEKILNHTSGSFRGVVGVYQRHSFADEKRHALEAWGHHVDGLVSGKLARHVVPIKARV